eukprot:gene18478-20329_t
MSPSSHEEALTGMFVHLKHLSSSGHENVTIKTVDMDIVVTARSLFREFGLVQLWIEFEMGKDKRWLPIHYYANALGENICAAVAIQFLLLLRKRKGHYLGYMEGLARNYRRFRCLSNSPNEIKTDEMLLLQRYVNLFYDGSSHCLTVNDARRCLFTKKSRTVEGLPPTDDALLQHATCAAFQGGYMESSGVPDPVDEIDLAALEMVYAQRINQSLEEFANQWNNHPLSSCQNKSPLQLIEMDKLSEASNRDYDMGEVDEFYGVDEDGPIGVLQTNNVVVPSLELDFDDITNNFDILADDGNHGINIYEQVRAHQKT